MVTFNSMADACFHNIHDVAINNLLIVTYQDDPSALDVNYSFDISSDPFRYGINPYHLTSSNHSRHLHPFMSYFDSSYFRTG